MRNKKKETKNSPSTPHSSILLLMAVSFLVAVLSDAAALTLSIVSLVKAASIVVVDIVVVGIDDGNGNGKYDSVALGQRGEG